MFSSWRQAADDIFQKDSTLYTSYFQREIAYGTAEFVQSDCAIRETQNGS